MTAKSDNKPRDIIPHYDCYQEEELPATSLYSLIVFRSVQLLALKHKYKKHTMAK